MLPSHAGSTTKPFESASQRPTVSPYLNLYREEDDESAPNYFAFVRPALQQQDANRRQQSEIQRLQRQLQRAANYTPASPAATASGSSARYLDTAHYYSRFSR
jgi:hypothetical protein